MPHFDELTPAQQDKVVERETSRIAYDFGSSKYRYLPEHNHPLQTAVDAVTARVGPGPKATEILLSRHYDLIEKEARHWASGTFYITEKIR